MHQPRRALAFVCGALTSATANAQFAYQGGPYQLNVEGFANATGAAAVRDRNQFDAHGGAGRIDFETRVLALADTAHGFAVGPRITFRGTESKAIQRGEYSLLVTSEWGRVEFGRRRGLPDTLTGYGPNAYQFVSSDYGPASGPSLDPDGGLASTFIDSKLATKLNSLASLGITATAFADESPKVIYVSPKSHGLLGGISYSRNVDSKTGHYDALLQTGLVYEKYWEQNVLRVGGSYSYADGKTNSNASTTRTDSLHSFCGGVSLTLDDALTIAASFTFNGDTGLQHLRSETRIADAYGYAISANYNHGPWTFGGFYQAARDEGNAAIHGSENLHAVQFGGSYRVNTQIRAFGAIYLYGFDDDHAQSSGGNSHDNGEMLLGIRFAL